MDYTLNDVGTLVHRCLQIFPSQDYRSAQNVFSKQFQFFQQIFSEIGTYLLTYKLLAFVRRCDLSKKLYFISFSYFILYQYVYLFLLFFTRSSVLDYLTNFFETHEISFFVFHSVFYLSYVTYVLYQFPILRDFFSTIFQFKNTSVCFSSFQNWELRSKVVINFPSKTRKEKL